MAFTHRQLFKHKHLPGGAGGGSRPYVSPYLLEILSTRPGAPSWPVATGSLVANAPGLQVVSCTRATSGYCLGNDGLLHLLGANTVRVEPQGLLIEQASTNYVFPTALASLPAFAGDATPSYYYAGGGTITATPNSTDVVDPVGTNTAMKVVWGARAATDIAWLISLTSAGGNSTASVYIRGATGQGNQTIYLNRMAEGVNGAVPFTVGETWTRISAKSNGYWVVGYGDDAGDSQPSVTNVTFYVWGPQNESDYCISSFIPTTSAPATRDADYVTVSNPLAALSQPVPTYRTGTWAKPPTGAGATWNTIGTGGLSILLATGTNGSNNSFRVGIGVGYHTNGGGDLTGNSGGAASFDIGPPGWADPTTNDALTALVMVGNSGVDVTTVPPAIGQPVTAAASFNPMDPFITIGNPVGFVQYGHQGHMRDIFVDNT